MSKLVFSDGGLYHRPDRPHVFSPGVRAAAHYLKAVEQVDPEVPMKLSEEVLGKHRFPTGFPGWQGIGLFPKRVTHKPIPGQLPGPQREQFEEARPLLRALRLWLNEYYMWSPFVLDLLYRTLQLREEFRRDFACLRMTIHEYESEAATLTEAETNTLNELRDCERLLRKEQEGWGWWVDFLASDITIPHLNAWFRDETAENDEHRELFERMDRLQIDITWGPLASARPFRLILEGWQPEVETWAAAEERFRDGFNKALKNYRSVHDERLKSGFLNPRPENASLQKKASNPQKGDSDPQENKERGVTWGEPHKWEAAPTKYGAEHFQWLALRQVKGLRPSEIASDHTDRKKVSAVNEALEGTARLLQLELRPVRSGPPSVLGD